MRQGLSRQLWALIRLYCDVLLHPCSCLRCFRVHLNSGENRAIPPTFMQACCWLVGRLLILDSFCTQTPNHKAGFTPGNLGCLQPVYSQQGKSYLPRSLDTHLRYPMTQLPKESPIYKPSIYPVRVLLLSLHYSLRKLGILLTLPGMVNGLCMVL